MWLVDADCWYLTHTDIKNISATGIKMLDSNNINSERVGQALFIIKGIRSHHTLEPCTQAI